MLGHRIACAAHSQDREQQQEGGRGKKREGRKEPGTRKEGWREKEAGGAGDSVGMSHAAHAWIKARLKVMPLQRAKTRLRARARR